MTLPTWYTVTEVAEALRMHRNTLLREIEGLNMTATKVGGRWLMCQSDIDAYIRAAYNRPVPRRSTTG